jgi:hypothetical protein
MLFELYNALCKSSSDSGHHQSIFLFYKYICHPYSYSSPNIVKVIESRRMRWAVHVAPIGEGRGVYRVLVVRPEGKRPLGRPRRRWEDNIKMDFRKIGIDEANWIQLAQDRVH